MPGPQVLAYAIVLTAAMVGAGAASPAAAQLPNPLQSASVVVAPAGVRPAAWTPDATAVTSGGAVTWTNLDVAPHQPADKFLPTAPPQGGPVPPIINPPSGRCFDAGAMAALIRLLPLPPGVNLPPATVTATFTYDGAALQSTVGTLTKTCPADTFVVVKNPDTGLDAAVIPYFCAIHGDAMWGGAILVKKA